jgi:uncharacterized membrane protein YtjA (UPF0391 family)
MLRLALTCLVISFMAAIFGFGGVASEFDGIARMLFYLAFTLFVFLLIAGLLAGNKLW